MKRAIYIICFIVCSLCGSVKAQTDSVDVLNYNIRLDIGRQLANQSMGSTTLTLQLLRHCDTITLDFKPGTIDSVCYDGERIEGFRQKGEKLYLPTHQFVPNQSVNIAIYFTEGAHVESYGWGGFHFDSQIHYNLGVAFEEYPHNFGRAWFPCRDNFHDKATYDITITSKPGWTALCSGIRQSRVQNEDGSETSYWRLSQETSTYLVSVAVAPWRVIERTYVGLENTYPAMIGYTSSHDSLAVYQSCQLLEDVLPMYERCFGPYRWGRIGYVATPKGSMEHANNIGLVSSCMGSMESSCQSVIAHEFAHAWFGNLLTCATSGDMWINEGGATFCEELAREAVANKEAANYYYQNKLESVIRTTHHSDGSYLALNGVDRDHTYGNTSYQKGAMVWHSLRGYLGDSLFYTSMRRLFDDCAFSSMDAYQLRDSLSAYSGVDLTGFFDFHVFQPGFVDYHVDSLLIDGREASIYLHQQLRGADQYANANRVPITFFSPNLDTCTRWMYFDGSEANAHFQLPFDVALAVVDFNKALSDAVTDDMVSITNSNSVSMDLEHCTLKALHLDSPAHLHIACHFSAPEQQSQEGIVRYTNHYWTVTGILPWEDQIRGSFEYSRRLSVNSLNGYLDEDFYTKSNSLDSIRLMYRRNGAEPWQAVSGKHSSDNMSGYFTTDNLQLGEYTLAVVDTALVSLSEVAETYSVTIKPNPAKGGAFALDVTGLSERYMLRVIDSQGKVVYHKDSLRGSGKHQPKLPKGTYIVQLFGMQGQMLHSEPLIAY